MVTQGGLVGDVRFRLPSRSVVPTVRLMYHLEQHILTAVAEPERLAVLGGFALGSAEADSRLDEIAREAAQACRTPVGIVTVLDADRQWNVGRHGTALAAMPVGISMCAHVIHAGTTVVSDLRFDERFADHPLVATDDGLRFYAGVPVRMAGVVIGSVSVADLQPRSLGPTARHRLAALASSAAAVLQSRHLAAVV